MSNQTMTQVPQNAQQPQPTEETRRLRPSVDLIESEGEFVMHIEMPGVSPDHVEVSIERNVLTVKGVADYHVPEGAHLLAGDAGRRSYERSFQLSDDIDRETIDAEIKHGVLTLKFSKADKARKATIPVKSA